MSTLVVSKMQKVYTGKGGYKSVLVLTILKCFIALLGPVVLLYILYGIVHKIYDEVKELKRDGKLPYLITGCVSFGIWIICGNIDNSSMTMCFGSLGLISIFLYLLFKEPKKSDEEISESLKKALEKSRLERSTPYYEERIKKEEKRLMREEKEAEAGLNEAIYGVYGNDTGRYENVNGELYKEVSSGFWNQHRTLIKVDRDPMEEGDIFELSFNTVE